MRHRILFGVCSQAFEKELDEEGLLFSLLHSRARPFGCK